MSTLSSWYTNQYSSTFRTSRLRAPSLVPSARLSTSNPITQQTLVVDAARNNNRNANEKDDAKNTKRRETIFGPDVGEDDEPGWTQPEDGVKIGVDVIKSWVEKAKSEEGLHATTTLQALVNLKRPTLQLQQLEHQPQPPQIGSASDGDIASVETEQKRNSTIIPTPPLNILKFNYDATTPLVNITLSIHPNPIVAVDGKESIQSEVDEIKTIYTGQHSGGFNQLFTLPQSCAIDLSSSIAPMPTRASIDENAIAEDDEKKEMFMRRESEMSVGNVARSTLSEDTNRSSLEGQMQNVNLSHQPDLSTVPEGQAVDENGGGGGRGRGIRNLFGRNRRREQDVESGQIEMTETNGEGENGQAEEEKEPERGMRLLIKIEGLGPEGQHLQKRNAQLTHILISGMWVTDAGAGTSGAVQPGRRVWVVKVVRREAIIGAHTFLLKEIYGLSTASNQNNPPSTYPPNQAEADPYASTPNECIVCLTSPRDVVLLPCRHLVVCRDCAVGMVEFGAGGKVARREDATAEDTAAGASATAAGGTTTAAAGAAAAAAAPQVAGGTTTGGRERRKKKAKGWYCPVCRQPYTSLLRLALPEASNPATEEGAVEAPPSAIVGATHIHTSRPGSIRSVRTTRTTGGKSLRRVSSRATLPDGAERMLESLRPNHGDDDEDVRAASDEEDGEGVPESERPQFVLGAEEHEEHGAVKSETVNSVPKEEKVEVEHQEVAQATLAREAEGRTSIDGAKKGWKEV